MIREFFKGLHSEDVELGEDYLDWFFLHHFGKEPGYWKALSEEKMSVLITLEQEKEKQYWDTWVKIYQEMNKK